MKHAKLAPWAVAMLMWWPAAYGGVVTFEDVSFTGVSTAAGPQVSGGFLFSPTSTGDLVRVQSGAGTCAGGCVDNGTQRLTLFNSDQTAPFEVELRALNGSAFDLLSFEFTENFIFTTALGAFVHLTGQRAGGGTVNASFEFDQIPNAFQVASVTGFTDLTSVRFSSDRYFVAFDNFAVAQIPEPSSLLLVCGGLLAAATRRRKTLCARVCESMPARQE